MLKIINVEDKESIIENWVIDQMLLDEINHDIDNGTMIRREAIVTHQYGIGNICRERSDRISIDIFNIYL